MSQRRQQGHELSCVLTVTAHEQVQMFLDPDQFFAQSGDHRTHGVAIRPLQVCVGVVDNRWFSQRLAEVVQARVEQTGFNQQRLPTRAAQLIDQWQHRQRQVAPGALHLLQVFGQLQHGLGQPPRGFVLPLHPPLAYRQG
ncbi:hypothetical protein D3C76_931090 [compost metagenome]